MPQIQDTNAKDYLGKPLIFADIFNYFLYDGEQIIVPDALKEMDPTELTVIHGKETIPIQRLRDLLKLFTIKTDGDVFYVLLGLEAQTDIHYAMPVRNMLYDGLQYMEQVRQAADTHDALKDHQGITPGEFLSKFYRTDRLTPVITLTLCLSPADWDAPRSLHEMMNVPDNRLLDFIANYKLNLVSPANLEQTDFDKFRSELREVLMYIKHSDDKEGLRKLLQEEKKFTSLSRDAVSLLNAVTKTGIKYNEDEEEVNVCKAIEDMMNDAKSAGREEGRNKGREEGRKEGREEGREEGIVSTALNMLKDNLDFATIAKYTHLPLERLQTLNASLAR